MDELKLENQRLVDCETECKLLESEIRAKKAELFNQRRQKVSIQQKINDLIKSDLLPKEEEDEEDEFAFQ